MADPNNPFLNFNASPETHQQRVSLVPLQWINADPKSTDPQCVATTGGFFCEDQIVPEMKPGWFVTDDGTRIVGFFAPALTVALLTRRSRWVVVDGDGNAQTFPSYSHAEDELGSLAKKGRSHLQVAMLIKGDPEQEPRGLTLRGMAGDGVQLWQAEIVKQLATPATRWKRHAEKNPAAPAVPFWAFWVELRVGPVKEVGSTQKKKITPPELVTTKVTGPQWQKVLIDAFIGRPLADVAEQWLLGPGKQWKDAWKGGGQVDNHAAPAPSGPPAGEEPPPPDDEWAPQ